MSSRRDAAHEGELGCTTIDEGDVIVTLDILEPGDGLEVSVSATGGLTDGYRCAEGWLNTFVVERNADSDEWRVVGGTVPVGVT